MFAVDPELGRIQRDSAQIMQRMVACGAVKPPAIKITTQDALRQVWRENQNARNAKKRAARLVALAVMLANQGFAGAISEFPRTSTLNPGDLFVIAAVGGTNKTGYVNHSIQWSDLILSDQRRTEKGFSQNVKTLAFTAIGSGFVGVLCGAALVSRKNLNSKQA